MIKDVLLSVVFLLIVFSSQGQSENQYSEEELVKYATVMKWAEERKNEMTTTYNGWINSNEVISAPRFIKIKNAQTDSLKLTQLEVDTEEMDAFDQIINDYDSLISSFTDVYKQKIRDEIGASLYNKLKKDLKNDQAIKTRYEAVLSGLKEQESGSD